jgi:HB1, ASXL, restriction endonuclease HTH domain
MFSSIQTVDRQDQEFTEALRGRRDRLAAQLDNYVHKQAELQATISRIREELSHIEALLGQDLSETPGSPQDRNAFADLVVGLLEETGQPMHYREIYEELGRRGQVSVGGRDPANALLARYFSDERLYRPARGTYAVRTKASLKSVGTRRKSQRNR